ncbi:Heterokaryon incompatibility protein [Rutstroemia sp. NJR-2017a BVV2]|nr:Heterokaryon incompatibility protein [Rutstroemia sp. NJR-2017a BVV2]
MGERPKTETTKDNIDCFKQALPMEELPQTFKDAITVTRQLGLQYIWIDSLCIIQHDQEDWFRESAKMGDIFESSSCTLAAVDALDDDSND